MTLIENSIVIERPPEVVGEYLADPLHLPEIWPSLIDVRDVERLPNGGARYHWVYKMAGVRFEGESETAEFEPARHLVQKNTGQIPSTFDWTFTPENGSTRIVFKAEYEIPPTLLGKVARPFVIKLNEREAEVFAANLKDRLEHEA